MRPPSGATVGSGLPSSKNLPPTPTILRESSGIAVRVYEEGERFLTPLEPRQRNDLPSQLPLGLLAVSVLPTGQCPHRHSEQRMLSRQFTGQLPLHASDLGRIINDSMPRHKPFHAVTP